MSFLAAIVAVVLATPTPCRADDGGGPDEGTGGEEDPSRSGPPADAPPAAADAPVTPALSGSVPTSHAPPPVPVALTPSDRLAAAVRSYHLGQHDLALSQLTALTRDLPEDSPISRDARLYIGEIFFVQGNEPGAREAFRAVIRTWPDLVLDPFRHPPDVCAFFELVKEGELQRMAEEARAAEPSSTASPPPSPFLPLGVAQFRQRRAVPGLLFGVGQAVSCGISLGLGTWLLVDRRYDPTPSDEIPTVSDGATIWDRPTLVARRSAQWAATGLCYGTYALGVTDAWLANRRQAGRAAAGEQPPGSPMVVLGGRF